MLNINKNLYKKRLLLGTLRGNKLYQTRIMEVRTESTILEDQKVGRQVSQVRKE